MSSSSASVTVETKYASLTYEVPEELRVFELDEQYRDIASATINLFSATLLAPSLLHFYARLVTNMADMMKEELREITERSE